MTKRDSFQKSTFIQILFKILFCYQDVLKYVSNNMLNAPDVNGLKDVISMFWKPESGLLDKK